MSHRPITAKKIARLRKAINRHPLPAYIDLIQWLKLRGIAQSTGHAEKIILAGRVRSDSHRLGVITVKVFEGGKVIDKEIVQSRVPAKLRQTLHVLPEKT